MQFNTIEFLLFFIIFYILYWAVKKNLVIQNTLLLAASYFFYGWWDWRFTLLLAFATIFTWGCGLCAAGRFRRVATFTGIIVNLAILFFFKYFDFFARGLERLLSMMDLTPDPFTLDIMLPIAISFYTFQAIAYLVDIYRRTIHPTRSLLVFAVFQAFFPQLLAGPIERAGNLIPQFQAPRQWDYRLAVNGIREVLWGLFKKVAIADMAALYIERLEANLNQDPLQLSIAAILFVLQIYCDFSGYCNIARGLAAILGIRLSQNFRSPLLSQNPSDFWRRWHVTLMSWLRDYVYIPLGGSRRGVASTLLNIAIVFLISGLWHGASLRFVIWGVMWGAIVVVYRLCKVHNLWEKNWLPRSLIGNIAGGMMMGIILTMTFIFFRFNPAHACSMAASVLPWTLLIFLSIALIMTCFIYCYRRHATLAIILPAIALLVYSISRFSPGFAISLIVRSVFPIAVISLFWVEFTISRHPFSFARRIHTSPCLRTLGYWALIFAIILSNNTGQPFIYYRF